MKMKLMFSLVLAFFVLLKLFPQPARAINPAGVRQMPAVIYEMLDCVNTDFGLTHPEWGPIGGWRDFGANAPGCTGSDPTNYIRKAKTMTITLADGTQIPKPVGVGWRATLNNINNWLFLNNEEFTNLAFIVPESPSCYGEVTGTYGTCPQTGQPIEDTLVWAKGIMGPISRAFPQIPVFFQACGYAGELLSIAKANGYSNIAVKCNSWRLDPDNAMDWKDYTTNYTSTPCQLTNGIITGGHVGFASVYYQSHLVGFEPKTGPSTDEWYWVATQALSHHPDMVDIDTPDIQKFYQFNQSYGFNLLGFFQEHLGKNINDAPSFWTIIRDTSINSVRDCTEDENGKPVSSPPGCDCCWRFSAPPRPWVCIGPQRGNFSYWLYQRDDLAGGSTKVIIPADLPPSAKAHPYGFSKSRGTDTNNPYIYFNIDDSYLNPNNHGWEIQLTYLDRGTDKFSLEYRKKDSSLSRNIFQKTATNKWKEVTLAVSQANFANSFDNKADFRLNSENDGNEVVHRVILKKTGPESCPTQSLGNLNCDEDILVNQDDLAILLASWAPQGSSSNFPPNLNQDTAYQIDEADLTFLLKNWQD